MPATTITGLGWILSSCQYLYSYWPRGGNPDTSLRKRLCRWTPGRRDFWGKTHRWGPRRVETWYYLGRNYSKLSWLVVNFIPLTGSVTHSEEVAVSRVPAQRCVLQAGGLRELKCPEWQQRSLILFKLVRLILVEPEICKTQLRLHISISIYYILYL